MKGRRFVPNLKSDVKKSSEPEASLCTNEVETLISTSQSPPAAPSIAPLPSQAETSTVDRNSVPHLPSESVNVASIENQTILAQDMTQGVSISKNSRPSEFSHTPAVLCDPSQSPAPYYSSSNTSSEKKVEAVYAARDFLTQIDDLRQSSNEVPTVRRKRDREPSTALETSDPMINQESSSIFPSPQYVLLTRYVIRRRQGLGLRLRNVEGRAVIGGFTEEYLANHTKTQATDLHIGDIIMAVDNADTSNPLLCPFNKVVKYLQGAGDVREKSANLQQIDNTREISRYSDPSYRKNCWDLISMTTAAGMLSKANAVRVVQSLSPSDRDS